MGRKRNNKRQQFRRGATVYGKSQATKSQATKLGRLQKGRRMAAGGKGTGLKKYIKPEFQPYQPDEGPVLGGPTRDECVEWDEMSNVCVRYECFIPEAKVLMGDGTTKQIKDIVVGDKVQGVHGINIVVNTPRFKLGNQPLHGFNGRNPFVTSMHPIMTDKGWANFNPEIYKEQWPSDYTEIASFNESNEILKLSIGDNVAFWNNKIEYKSLEDYIEKEEHPNFKVYNLTLDNDHTFIVEGVVVHNKSMTPCIPDPYCIPEEGCADLDETACDEAGCTWQEDTSCYACCNYGICTNYASDVSCYGGDYYIGKVCDDNPCTGWTCDEGTFFCYESDGGQYDSQADCNDVCNVQTIYPPEHDVYDSCAEAGGQYNPLTETLTCECSGDNVYGGRCVWDDGTITEAVLTIHGSYFWTVYEDCMIGYTFGDRWEWTGPMQPFWDLPGCYDCGGPGCSIGGDSDPFYDYPGSCSCGQLKKGGQLKRGRTMKKHPGRRFTKPKKYGHGGLTHKGGQLKRGRTMKKHPGRRFTKPKKYGHGGLTHKGGVRPVRRDPQGACTQQNCNGRPCRRGSSCISKTFQGILSCNCVVDQPTDEGTCDNMICSGCGYETSPTYGLLDIDLGCNTTPLDRHCIYDASQVNLGYAGTFGTHGTCVDPTTGQMRNGCHRECKELHVEMSHIRDWDPGFQYPFAHEEDCESGCKCASWFVLNCDGSNSCCPSEWVGDPIPDCPEAVGTFPALARGCDLSCWGDDYNPEWDDFNLGGCSGTQGSATTPKQIRLTDKEPNIPNNIGVIGGGPNGGTLQATKIGKMTYFYEDGYDNPPPNIGSSGMTGRTGRKLSHGGGASNSGCKMWTSKYDCQSNSCQWDFNNIICH